MGNLSALTDPKELLPYLPVFLPGLQEILVDAVPEARAISAKAIGNMVGKVGEKNFPGLVDQLFQILNSDTSTVDQSGAAQGFSKIFAALGTIRLDSVFTDILFGTTNTRQYVREGNMTLLMFLPITFGEKFTSYLPRIVPVVLKCLADEAEAVRNCSLRVGQIVVRNFANSAVDLLMPELEVGMSK